MVAAVGSKKDKQSALHYTTLQHYILIVLCFHTTPRFIQIYTMFLGIELVKLTLCVGVECDHLKFNQI